VTRASASDQAAIRIEEIRVKDLVQFAERHLEDHLRGRVVPISKLRAAAHANNPYADPDDVALIVAMNGDECVGYVGIMPGILRADGERHKVYWFTTWYGRADRDQSNAGGVLLLASVALRVDLLGADLAPETLEYYRRARFTPLGPVPYFELSFDRFDPLGAPWQLLRVLLRRRGRRLGALDAAFSAFRGITKALVYGLLGGVIARSRGDLEFRETSELPPEASRRDQRETPRFGRDVKLVRWALRYPWVTDEPEKATPGFFFSDYRELARFVTLEVREGGRQEPLGHLVVSICRDQGRTSVKILDHFLEPHDAPGIILAAALTYARRHRADRVLVPESCGRHLEKARPLAWLFRRKYRFYYCHPKRRGSVLAPVLDRIELGFCDGDTPFT
jgi:hypothetical protein